MAEHDLVIRGGTVIDGSGDQRRTADVAVSDGVITHVGEVSGTGRREVDLVIERRDGALVAIEIKAATLVEQHDARHLAWFREQLPAGELRAGVVFYTGTLVRRLDERIWAVPICALWG